MYLLDPPSSISDWLRSCLLSCEQIRHAEASCSKFSEASKFLEDFRDPEIHIQYIYTVTLNITCTNETTAFCSNNREDPHVNSSYSKHLTNQR